MAIEIGEQYIYNNPLAFPAYKHGMTVTITASLNGGLGYSYTAVYKDGGTGRGTMGKDVAERFLVPSR